jgi:hypothetical protein
MFGLITLFNSYSVRAQEKSRASEILSHNQVLSIINDTVKKAFKIDLPIFRVYKYTDASGQYFCVLTESNDSFALTKEGEPDTAHHMIRAIDLKLENGKFVKMWEINDFIKHNGAEISIWFWTKFCAFDDLDKDGLIEPIIVYGTHSMDEIDGNRVKFIICYKGQKIAIRHHDSDLDDGRYTEVDRTFHALPQNLKNAVRAKMEMINKLGLAIFEKTAL